MDQTLQLRRKCGKKYVIWMQLGIVNKEAARKAEEAGFMVVMDRCTMIERRKLDAEKR